MRQIIIKNQEELNELPKAFDEYTYIEIDSTEPIHKIKCVPKNSHITLVGETVVKYLFATVNLMRDHSRINIMMENAHVNEMSESAQVDEMSENAQVDVMWGNSQVSKMRNRSQIKKMFGSSQVGEMWESSQVQEMRKHSQIKEMFNMSHVGIMRENAQIKEMRASSQVNMMRESSHINMMKECSQVNAAFENVCIKAFSPYVVISRLKHKSTLICQDCTVDVKEKDDTANIIYTKTMIHTKKSFLDIYKDNMIDENNIILYKSVNPNTLCDFYTGEIKYEGVVICPDWDDDENRECGGGLHLSPTPEETLYYNKGKVLKCKVHVDDIVVHPYHINKVRCKKIEVLEEVL